MPISHQSMNSADIIYCRPVHYVSLATMRKLLSHAINAAKWKFIPLRSFSEGGGEAVQEDLKLIMRNEARVQEYF